MHFVASGQHGSLSSSATINLMTCRCINKWMSRVREFDSCTQVTHSKQSILWKPMIRVSTLIFDEIVILTLDCAVRMSINYIGRARMPSLLVFNFFFGVSPFHFVSFWHQQPVNYVILLFFVARKRSLFTSLTFRGRFHSLHNTSAHGRVLLRIFFLHFVIFPYFITFGLRWRRSRSMPIYFANFIFFGK